MSAEVKNFTKEEWIEKRTAEGFTKEDAINEYEGKQDPAVAEAHEQKVPTRGEMLEMIHKATLNNPNKKKRYEPNFKLSKEYKTLQAEVEKAEQENDYKKAEKLTKQMIAIQVSGTVTNEERQAEIDKTLEMPIASILKERKKYEVIVLECEEKLDNFDISGVQAKVDALEEAYREQSKGKNPIAQAGLYAALQEDINDLEMEMVTIPMNELALKRYRAKEFFSVYEARVKYYVLANKSLIEKEIENAKRAEIRGSLVDLAGYVEEV